MIYENLSTREMMRRLWESDKVSKEDREWLDKNSSKKSFKFSEEEEVVALMIKIFGQPSF